MKSGKLLFVAAVILTAVVSAHPQTDPNLENGFKAYGSYDGSNVDSVNLMNGNVMLHIPMPFTYPQRGGRIAPTNFLGISSKQWNVTCTTPSQSGPVCVWAAGGSGVTNMVVTTGNGVGFDTSLSFGLVRTTFSSTDSTGTTAGTLSYTLSTADGGSHLFAPMPNAPLDPNGQPMSLETVDDSGYHLDLSNPGTTGTGIFPGVPATGTLADRKGNLYAIRAFIGTCKATTNNTGPDAPAGSTTNCTERAQIPSTTDGNGNVYTSGLPAEGSLPAIAAQDTMGRTFITSNGPASGSSSTCVYGGLPAATTSMFSYSTASGGTNQFYVCYGTLTIQTAFGQSGVLEIQNSPQPILPVTTPVITSLIMPDGSTWVFNYDSYANLTYVGLPLGGSISYTWETISPCVASATHFSRAVKSRTITDSNGHSFTWNYQWGTIANRILTNTVTDANNNDTVHTFTDLNGGCLLFETTTQEYQGTGASRQLLKQVGTVYNAIQVGNTDFFGYNVTPASIQTTVFPSGKVSLVTKQYENGFGPNAPMFGGVTKEVEYDWGQGAPSTVVLRETDTTYQWQVNSGYLTAHMPDLPASVIVKDGSGCSLSETDYTYDEPNYLTPYTGTLPNGTHGAAPNPAPIRGNLSSVTRWLAPTGSCNPKGGTAVVTHNNWYDTGEIYQQIDALGNATRHSYDPAYAGAYSTQTCSPTTNSVAHCVSGTYDFTTGLLTSFTNENATSQANGTTPGDSAHTTLYAYDLMARLTSATFPPDPGNGGAQAHTNFTYPVPISLPFTVTRTKSITPSLTDSVTSTYDGLGRVYKTQHPLPNGTAEVDTVYDGLDHVISITNPYFSTSDPTYGVIQTQYDALGRATQVTDQDGSIRSVTYNVAPIPGVLGNCSVTTDEAGHQRKTCSDALGRLVEVDEVNPGVGASFAAGSISVSGTEQQATTQPATAGSGAVTINGSEQSGQYCTLRCTTVWDIGSVTVTVNGFSKTVSYGKFDTGTTVASNLVNAFNGDGNSPVTASGASNVLSLTAKATGAATNYSLSSSSATGDSTGTFSGPSFIPTPASGALTGGHNAAITPDSGNVTATISGTSYTVSYGANDTSNTIAANLSSAISAGTLANASSSGGTINITSKTSGPGYDYSLSASYTWNSNQFANPSFTTAASGSSLIGGYNAGDPANRPFVTQYSYDGLGNLLNVTQKGDPTSSNSSQWRVRTFTYDTLSRLLTANNPESGTISYSYDADGNLLQKTSPAPNQTGTATQTISYCYDALNRVTWRSYSGDACVTGQAPPDTAVVTYAYDSGANGIGRLSQVVDQPGFVIYTYDVLGRLASEQRVISGVSKSMSYSYNLDGSLKTLTNPSGAAITYTPDSAGRDVSAVDNGNAINYVTGASYGADSSLTGFISGQSSGFNGITNSFTYNKRLQPVNMAAVSPTATVFSLNYDFHVGNGASGSDNGNVFGITNNKDTTRNQSFTYDALNRLTSAQNAGTNCSAMTVNGKTEYWGNSYGYDAWGNLLAKTVTKCSAENFSVTALANNQLSGYSYDAAGNMAFDATDGHSYTYDEENRISYVDLNTSGGNLASINSVGSPGFAGSSGFAEQYAYDADGNRVEKSNGSTGTLYWYMSPGIVAESDLSGNLQSEYVFFDGERVARRDGPNGSGGVFYYFSDHLKTTDVVTNAQGTILNESDFYPWGGELQFAANDSNHYKFTGKERDSETNLDYFGARYYSNGLGRFITPDWAAKPESVPYADLNDPQSLNQYSYVRNIPTTRVDADGHCPWCPAFEEAVEELSETPAGQELLEAGAKVAGAIGTGAAAGWAATSGVAQNAWNALLDGLGNSGGCCLTDLPQPSGGAVNNLLSQQKASPPNPNGSKGAPDHQETADEEAAKMGGDREVRVQTPGGEKESRVIDAAKVKNGKVTKATQVIRPNKNGTPPAREVRAANDIQKATGVKPKLVPVRPFKKRKKSGK